MTNDPGEQARQERAAQQVSDVLQQLDWTIERAERGLRVIEKDRSDANAELAITELREQLTMLRRRFVQDTYYGTDPRLL